MLRNLGFWNLFYTYLMQENNLIFILIFNKINKACKVWHMRKVLWMIVFLTSFGSSGTGFLSQLRNKTWNCRVFYYGRYKRFGAAFFQEQRQKKLDNIKSSHVPQLELKIQLFLEKYKMNHERTVNSGSWRASNNGVNSKVIKP